MIELIIFLIDYTRLYFLNDCVRLPDNQKYYNLVHMKN